jgi:biotin carboxyl carrier protein
MNKFNLPWNGELKKIAALRHGHELWIHVDGETHRLDMRPKNKKANGDSDIKTGEIMSPMPGRILKINAQTGATVKENDVLVIMEAMKMEYTLKSNKNGVIKEVFCKVGDQVELNQKLVIVGD